MSGVVVRDRESYFQFKEPDGKFRETLDLRRVTGPVSGMACKVGQCLVWRREESGELRQRKWSLRKTDRKF